MYPTCDHCESTSEIGFPRCRECMDHICPRCQRPGSERTDVDRWDCECLKCSELERVWLRDVLRQAITVQSLTEAIGDSTAFDQHEDPVVQFDVMAEILRDKVAAASTSKEFTAKLKQVIGRKHLEDLFDDRVDYAWIVAHLHDWLEQELMEDGK